MKFDASDEDGDEDESGDRGPQINLQDWPTVKGMYMPDTIVTFNTGGRRCEYDCNNEANMSPVKREEHVYNLEFCCIRRGSHF